jgi:hypothetical protein
LSIAVELSEAAVLLDLAAVLSLSPAEPAAAIAGMTTRPKANRFATNARITSSLKFDCHIFLTVKTETCNRGLQKLRHCPPTVAG